MAHKQLLIAEKATVDDRFDPIFRLLRDLLSILAGEMTPGQSVWLQKDSLAIEPWLDLFGCLALHWVGEKPGARLLARLKKYCKAARMSGLFWYAREATLLLKTAGKQDACAQIERETEEAAALRPMTDLFCPEAPWERTLRALKGVREGTPGAATGPRAGRCRWSACMSSETLSITCRRRTAESANRSSRRPPTDTSGATPRPATVWTAHDSFRDRRRW